VPQSIGLYETAHGLIIKGHFARAAEKHGRAAAAAAQELAAEDCLVVAYQRAAQAEALMYHSSAPTLTAAEVAEARETVVSVLLPQCMSTLMRRKAAGTLLPGSCRVEEVAWCRVFMERKLLRDGAPAEVARAGAQALAPTLGFEAYMFAACVALCSLNIAGPVTMSREMQLSHAALVASAFEMMAQPQELPSVVMDNEKHKLTSVPEGMLARTAHRMFLDARVISNMEGDVSSLMVDAWRRVERSGAIAMRRLRVDAEPAMSINACLAAAAADAAVRGLRECALAGCASKEVHVSQFKHCGACRTVSYCCREHQVADWPSHKAACKAARKAAADPEQLLQQLPCSDADGTRESLRADAGRYAKHGSKTGGRRWLWTRKNPTRRLSIRSRPPFPDLTQPGAASLRAQRTAPAYGARSPPSRQSTRCAVLAKAAARCATTARGRLPTLYSAAPAWRSCAARHVAAAAVA
jgi:hypothetical protein